MKKHNAQKTLLASVGAVTGLLSLGACNDYLTGQDGEPAGPLKVIRLTLLDPGINYEHSVFTDTSVPPDCSDPKYKEARACNNDPFGDTYGSLKSPPNVDSAGRLRVVFNKAPLNLDGKPLEPLPDSGLPDLLQLTDPTVISLACSGCSTDGGKMGVPLTYNSLQLTGSNLSPEPSLFPYGPGLQMEVLNSCIGATARYKCCVQGLIKPPTGMFCKDLTTNPADDTGDPLGALEPDSTYNVVLKPGLSGRHVDEKVQLDATTMSLLTFKTESFVALGYGDHISESKLDSGDVVKLPAFTLKDKSMAMANVPVHGAVAVRFNAPVDETRFSLATVTAKIKVNGTAMPDVAVRASTASQAVEQDEETGDRKGSECSYGNRRTIYIAPVGGSWGTFAETDKVEVTITVKGSEIFDVSQVATMDPAGKLPPTHPAGKGLHALGKDLVINVALITKPEKVDPSIILARDAKVEKGMDLPDELSGSNGFIDDATTTACADVNRLK